MRIMTASNDDRSWYEPLKAQSNATDTALYENCLRECGRCSWCAAMGEPCEFLGVHDDAVFRQMVHDRAPLCLEELGIDQPFSRWREAVATIHRLHDQGVAEIRPLLKELGRYLMATGIWAKQSPEIRKEMPGIKELEEADYYFKHLHDT